MSIDNWALFYKNILKMIKYIMEQRVKCCKYNFYSINNRKLENSSCIKIILKF